MTKTWLLPPIPRRQRAALSTPTRYVLRLKTGSTRFKTTSSAHSFPAPSPSLPASAPSSPMSTSTWLPVGRLPSALRRRPSLCSRVSRKEERSSLGWKGKPERLVRYVSYSLTRPARDLNSHVQRELSSPLPPSSPFPSSSPIDVSFTATQASGTPLASFPPRALLTEADTSSRRNRRGRENALPRTGGSGNTGKTPIRLVTINRANALGQSPLSPTASGGNHSRSTTTASQEMYWRHVSTPKAIMTPIASASTQAQTGIASEHAGKPSTVLSPMNEPRNDRKRPWEGSPNVEDALRSQRRLRMAATVTKSTKSTRTPRSRTSLPRTRRFSAGSSNPWRSERTRREFAFLGSDNVFAPVDVSTPRSSAGSTRPEDQSLPLHVNTSGQPPTPHANGADSSNPQPRNGQDEHYDSPPPAAQRPRSSPSETPMAVDSGDEISEVESQTHAPNTAHSGAKGK